MTFLVEPTQSVYHIGNDETEKRTDGCSGNHIGQEVRT